MHRLLSFGWKGSVGGRRKPNVMVNVSATQNRQFEPPDGASQLEIRLLGPIAIARDGKPVSIASRKARALLGYLALREGTEISRDILTGLLWAERSEGQARASLRQTLSELRTALAGPGQHPITATKETISWTPGTAWIDAKIVATAGSSRDEASLTEAAALIRGELLEGLSVSEAGFEHWLASERERFRLVATGIYNRLMELAEHDGRTEAALTSGLKLLSLDPLQEHVHRALMRLYAAQGRHDAALAQYERCCRELSNQLQERPDRETEELARSIRTSRGERSEREQDNAKIAPAPQIDATKSRWGSDVSASNAKPSIAILPFINLSTGAEQDFLAAGIVEDLVTQLSRLRDLLVIARNETLVFEDRNREINNAAHEFGVRYVLEGSVRRASNRIRVTAQLVDTASGQHIWAERYDRELGDLFALQDEITKAVTVALQVNLTEGDAARIAAEGTRNLEAWEAFLQGKAAFLTFTKADNLRAKRFFEQAVHHDPTYALALAALANTHWLDARFLYTPDPAVSLELAKDSVRRAEELVGETGAVLFVKGNIALVERRHDEAFAFHRRAVELSPSDAECAAVLGMTQIYIGDFQGAIVSLKTSQRLSPYFINWAIYYFAFAYLWLGDLNQARSAAALYLGREPKEPFAYLLSAIVEGAAGRPSAARDYITVVLARHPELTCASFAHAQFYRESGRLQRLLAWLKDAGLPE